MTAAAVFVGCSALLLVASRLAPAAEGFGSHRQLGLPPCSLLVVVGYPCPTCGMTTAFSYAVRGRLASAFHAQPAGFFLASATVVAAALALSTMLTGRVWMVNWYRVSPTWIVFGLALVVIGGWFYKLGVGIAAGTLPLTG